MAWKTVKNPKNNIVNFRLTDEEKRQFSLKASSLNMTLSDMIRHELGLKK